MTTTKIVSTFSFTVYPPEHSIEIGSGKVTSSLLSLMTQSMQAKKWEFFDWTVRQELSQPDPRTAMLPSVKVKSDRIFDFA